MKLEQKEIEKAAKYSINNREILNLSGICGCYYCESIYEPKEITDWVDVAEVYLEGKEYVIERYGEKTTLTEYIKGIVSRGQAGEIKEHQIDKERVRKEIQQGDTALCPICGIDSVVGGLSIKGEIKGYLREARKIMFNVREEEEKAKEEYKSRKEIKQKAKGSNLVCLKEYKERKALEAYIDAESQLGYDIIAIQSEIMEDVYEILYALLYEDNIEPYIEENADVIDEIMGIIGEALE